MVFDSLTFMIGNQTPLKDKLWASSNSHKSRGAPETRDSGGGRLGRYSLRRYASRLAAADQDPHFIAIGIAVGVFVGCTPTMPFHTVLAVALAFLLQGSKTAAALGTWVCNPLTFTFLYFGSYQTGIWLLGPFLPFPLRYEWLPDMLEKGFDATLAAVVGGIAIGIVPAVISYIISRKVISALRVNKKNQKWPLSTSETLHL